MHGMLNTLFRGEKPLFPYLFLGILSLMGMVYMIINWGDQRYEGRDSTLLDTVTTLWLIGLLGYHVHKHSQSQLRTPIAVLMVISTLYDVWVWRSGAVVFIDIRALVVECLWVVGVAFLYIDTSATRITSTTLQK